MITLPGDRMMTILLSRLCRAGVAEITLTADLDVVEIVPRTPLLSRFLPRLLRDGQRARVQAARAGVNALFLDPQVEPLFNKRTYAEALACRLGPLFSDGAQHVRLIPGRYQADPR